MKARYLQHFRVPATTGWQALGSRTEGRPPAMRIHWIIHAGHVGLKESGFISAAMLKTGHVKHWPQFGLLYNLYSQNETCRFVTEKHCPADHFGVEVTLKIRNFEVSGLNIVRDELALSELYRVDPVRRMIEPKRFLRVSSPNHSSHSPYSSIRY
jgi:hypothetical protein